MSGARLPAPPLPQPGLLPLRGKLRGEGHAALRVGRFLLPLRGAFALVRRVQALVRRAAGPIAVPVRRAFVLILCAFALILCAFVLIRGVPVRVPLAAVLLRGVPLALRLVQLRLLPAAGLIAVRARALLAAVLLRRVRAAGLVRIVRLAGLAGLLRPLAVTLLSGQVQVPQVVLVRQERLAQRAQHVRFQAALVFEIAVDLLRRQRHALAQQPLHDGLLLRLPLRGDARQPQAVDGAFGRDVAREVPADPVQARIDERMAERAVQHQVQEVARGPLALVAVAQQHVLRVIAQHLPVGGDAAAVRALGREAAQRRVEKAQVHQQRVARKAQHVPRQRVHAAQALVLVRARRRGRRRMFHAQPLSPLRRLRATSGPPRQSRCGGSDIPAKTR